MAQVRPFREVEAGGSISAAELNHAFEEIVRQSRITVAAPLAITEDWQGKKIRIDMAPAIHVRITGRETSGTPSGTTPSYFYSGIEQWSYLDGTVEDAPTGLHFYSNLCPLVEMAENASIETNTIAMATRAASGDHWEFLGSGETGSGSTPTTDQGCLKCCCCCVPCPGGIWLQFGAFSLKYCADSQTVPLQFPDMFLVKGTDNCWRCSGTVAHWMQSFAKVGNTDIGTIQLVISVCCPSKNSCPVLKIRGSFTINADGFTRTGVPPGTYKICIGPVSFDEVHACHALNPDESGGPSAGWDAILSSDTINECDQNNWDCSETDAGCYTEWGGPITAFCASTPCPRTGLPDSFALNVFDSSDLYGGLTQFGPDGADGTMFLTTNTSTAPCYQEWTGTVTTTSGCPFTVTIAQTATGYSISFSTTAGTCATLLATILSNDFIDPGLTTLACDPLCWVLTAHNGLGPGVVTFGSACGAALWTPAELGGKQAWQDPSTLPSGDGTALSSWDDNSGNSNSLTASSTARPSVKTNILNGYSVVRWDGTDDQMLYDTAMNGLRAIAIVWKSNANPSGLETPFGGGIVIPGGFANFVGNGATMFNAAASTEVKNGTLFRNGDTSGGVTPQSGAAYPVTTDGFVIDVFTMAANSATNLLSIGSDRGIAGRFINSDTAEIIPISTAPSTTDRQKLEGYLAWKYDLVSKLPADHPYKSAPPTV